MPTLTETEVHPTWWVAFRVWWAFMWRLILISFVVSMGVRLLLGLIGGKGDWQDDAVAMIGGLAFFAIEIDVIRRVLSKRYGSYRIAILKQSTEPGKPVETP